MTSTTDSAVTSFDAKILALEVERETKAVETPGILLTRFDSKDDTHDEHVMPDTLRVRTLRGCWSS